MRTDIRTVLKLELMRHLVKAGRQKGMHHGEKENDRRNDVERIRRGANFQLLDQAKFMPQLLDMMRFHFGISPFWNRKNKITAM